MIDGGYVPLAEVVRSGFREGVHYGACVVLGPGGAVASALGDPAQLRQVLAQLVTNSAEALEGRRGVEGSSMGGP